MNRVDGMSLFRCEPGRIAISVSFLTSLVIAFMLGVGQRFDFSGRQFFIVTGFPPILASREVALVL